jgi:dTDP-4-amino-4,6-dideoxygalactose transaminase
VPVFADLGPDTCNVDAEDVAGLIDADTGAVMVTHLHGLACDLDAITAACQRHGVPLVEDAAQAFGTRHRGRAVGTFGAAGIYSFGMYKNLNAFFGGMVVTPQAGLAERLHSEVQGFPEQEIQYYLSKVASGVASDLATWPPLFKTLTYRVFRYGFLNDVRLLNSQVTVDVNPELKRDLPESYLRRMTNMQARIVLSQLDAVDDNIRARIEYAKLYHAGLADLPGVVLPPLRTDFSHTYSYFPVQVEDRQAVLAHMMRERCDLAAQHLHNCADLPCFEEFHRDCPNARRTAASVILLPTYPRYSRRDAERNVASLRRYFGQA